MSRKWNWYEWYDGVSNYGVGNLHLIEDITLENLSWLPIEKVPVTEFLPFNSLNQPALSIYTRVEWHGILEQENVLGVFLEKHTDEMGYILVHKDDKLGILGVGFENDYQFHAGYGTIFNARKTDWKDDPCRSEKKLSYPDVPIILTSLSKTIESVCYEQGSRAFDHEIYNYDDFDDLSDD